MPYVLFLIHSIHIPSLQIHISLRCSFSFEIDIALSCPIYFILCSTSFGNSNCVQKLPWLNCRKGKEPSKKGSPTICMCELLGLCHLSCFVCDAKKSSEILGFSNTCPASPSVSHQVAYSGVPSMPRPGMSIPSVMTVSTFHMIASMAVGTPLIKSHKSAL